MKRLTFLLFVSGLTCITVSLILLVNGYAAAQEETPQESPSTLHPAIPLLDASGANVLDSGQPISPMQTCGACHDTEFIAEHSVHVSMGSNFTGAIDDDRDWVDGIGWFGGWNPITYQDDLPIEDWIKQFGWRHVGGGPAAEAGVEMNCFVCHIPGADNAARVAALEAGHFEWASTATLNNTGIVQQTDDGWTANPDAFDPEGRLREEYITIDAPTDQNCSFCHGVVHTNAQEPLVMDPFDLTQWTTTTTGQVFSPQRLNNSGLNLEDKITLSRSWDVHAERVVGCTDCHYSLNNPIFYIESEIGRPEHLEFDPRRMDYDDFLLRPLHQFANSGQVYAEAFPIFQRSVRDCASCHDAEASHEWLEYTQRHLNTLSCETCHIPDIHAPALAAVDWTILTQQGTPRMDYRGVDTSTDPVYMTGYEPVLLPDTEDRLAPYNIVSAWYWVHGDPAEPVTQEDLKTVYFDGDRYAAAVIEVFDTDGDGRLNDNELVIDTDEKSTLITQRLADLGLTNPRIVAQSEAYALHHGVTHGDWATRDCSTCHSEDSRLNQAFILSTDTPGGVQPTFLGDNMTGEITVDSNGNLIFTPSLAIGENGLYVLGHHSAPLVDILGVLIFVGSTFGVVVHAGLRVISARRQPTPHEPELREIYMYSIYERQWHWLQTALIFGLIFTGMVIHKPDIFGMFSFRGMVMIHNALALVLIINAALAAFYHLVSGEIKQFIPEPRGFFGQMFAQARFYAYGIFKGEPHPFEKTRNRKMNPIQQLTYFGLLNVLLPLQVITGVLMWGAQRFPALTDLVGGLPVLGPAHTLGSWLLATFIVVHVYMTTTGHTPLANIRAMIFGWDEVELHKHDQAPTSSPAD
ncbi:MAG: cytochrome b/b6 domain-containing protein [Chloroflexota bacterium]